MVVHRPLLSTPGVEKQLEDKEKKFQELSLHWAQIQLTVLNSNSNEDKYLVELLNKLKKSDVAQQFENPESNEEETIVFQAEQFNFSYPIATIPAGDNEENITDDNSKSKNEDEKNKVKPKKSKTKSKKRKISLKSHVEGVQEKKRNHECEQCDHI